MDIIWAYNGKYRTLSHWWRGSTYGNKRIALCGRKVSNTGDDSTCPQNEHPECNDCNAIALYNNLDRFS